MKNGVTCFLATMFVSIWSQACGDSASTPQAAETILHNGKIYTVDASRSWAQAIAISEGVILAVGSNEEVMALAGEGSQLIDLGGRMVMPGIVDVHAHATMGSLAGIRCYLPDTFQNPTLDVVVAAVKECNTRFEGDDWLYGYRFHANAVPAELYNAAWLDTIIDDRPVLLEDEPGHAYLTNSKGLEILRKETGLSEATEAPDGGVIGKDKNGNLNGVFRSTARNLLILEEDPNHDLRVDALRWGVTELFRQGTTTIMEPLVIPHDDRLYSHDMAVWKQVLETQQVSPRLDLCLYMGDGSYDPPPAQALVDSFKAAGLPDDVHMCVKVYGDGVLEGGTAALIENYANRDHNGTLGFEPEELQALVAEVDALGIPLKIHSIGDRTAREVLTAFGLVIDERGSNELRHHVAHITSVHPDDWPRFRELGVPAEFIGSVAARIPYVEAGYYPALGHDRFNLEMEPVAGIMRQGAVVAATSDWGAALLDNFRSIQTTITRKDPNNPNSEVAGPMHRIDLPMAIAVHTINGAYIMRRENEIGSLEIGKQADLIVLDQNLFDIPIENIRNTKVLLTLIGGRKAWQADGAHILN